MNKKLQLGIIFGTDGHVSKELRSYEFATLSRALEKVEILNYPWVGWHGQICHMIHVLLTIANINLS